MKLIERTSYLDRVLSMMGRNLIICLTGQRRVGKSSILRTLLARLDNAPETNTIYIDKEKSDFDAIVDAETLNAHIKAHLHPSTHNVVMIDEVQLISGFEKSLCNFYDDDTIDIIVTGSNAKMFSSELSTMLSGRYIDIHVNSLSYIEFLQFNHIDDSDRALERYLNVGGLPNLALFPADDSESINDYLSNIFNTIVIKDIVGREQIRNVQFLENLSRFIADNTGKLFSPNSISRFMQNAKESVTPGLVKSYTDYLCNAYILNRVARYDIHGKQLLTTNEKYYFEDMGLRNALTSGRRAADIEKLIENAIYLHLKTRGYNVNVGTLRNGEIDFVARKGDNVVYIQAAYLLAGDDTIAREFGNLLAIKDNHPKYVISMDPLQLTTGYDGIRHLRLRSFLADDRF